MYERLLASQELTGKHTMRCVCLIVVENILHYELQRARPLAPEPGCIGTQTATDNMNI